MKKFIIYSKQNCGYCVAAKTLLDEYGAIYEDRLVGGRFTPDDVREHCKKLLPEAEIRTVPQIILVNNGTESYIGGYEELEKIKESI